ncbi:MAG: 3'(2'),5'-bisphosphate nucleotidase CysQ [Sphingorhabdus sp.]
MTDGELAHFLAEEAGRMLLVLQQTGGLSGKELGDEGDRIANDFLMGMLRMRRVEDAILSEEERCDGLRLNARRVWIIDPLDGTREYGEGRSDWAVHVALAIDGVATVGAVALPGLGQTLSTQTPLLLQPAHASLKMVVSRSRPAAEAVKVAEALDAELLPMGSAGAKAMAVVRGEADIYLHTGGQFEWDNCAPVAVAEAAGLHVSRIDGSPMRYNNADPYLPDLLVCRKELVGRVFKAM